MYPASLRSSRLSTLVISIYPKKPKYLPLSMSKFLPKLKTLLGSHTERSAAGSPRLHASSQSYSPILRIAPATIILTFDVPRDGCCAYRFGRPDTVT